MAEKVIIYARMHNVGDETYLVKVTENPRQDDFGFIPDAMVFVKERGLAYYDAPVLDGDLLIELVRTSHEKETPKYLGLLTGLKPILRNFSAVLVKAVKETSISIPGEEIKVPSRGQNWVTANFPLETILKQIPAQAEINFEYQNGDK